MLAMPEPPADFSVGRDQVLRDLDAIVDAAKAHRPVADDPYLVVVSDIEGCLNRDPRTYDHAVLTRLREINLCASWTNAIPLLTLCTGRQSPFVDAVSAFVGVRLPIIFEGGCGLFFPTEPPGIRHEWHPRIAEAEEAGEYKRLQKAVERTAEAEEARPSLAKGRLLTFHARPGQTVDDLADAFRSALAAEEIAAEVTQSANAVDISIPGVTKGTALSWLLAKITDRGGPDIKLEQIVGVGDGFNDLAFLELAGMSVAPTNANSAVKSRVHYCSPYSDAKAVADAVIRATQHNLGEKWST